MNTSKTNNDIKIKKDIIHWRKENIEAGVAVDINVNSDWFCKLCNVYNKGIDAAFNMLITVAPAIVFFAFKMKSVNAEYGEVLMEAIDTEPEQETKDPDFDSIQELLNQFISMDK